MSFGGTVKLTGESEYKRALSQITQGLKEVGSEMQVVTSAFGKNDKSESALAAQTEVLTKKLELQKQRLSVLTAQYEDAAKVYAEHTEKHKALSVQLDDEKGKLEKIGRELGTTSKEYKAQEQVVADLSDAVDKSARAEENNAKQMSKMRIEINNAQRDCNNTARAIDDLGKETEETGKEARDAGEGFTVFKGILANLAASAIKTAASALVSLSKALINVGEQAIQSYASYEQLVGGVETLFKDAAGDVQEYAKVAYKTAGISANEYMEQVTSFSASLIQSLGGDTKKAAKIGDTAIRDMADNANKMGTAISSIQNAYQGFAKQNYTMLDNLKLGYGGTKKEAERLIADANKLKEAHGEMADLSIERFSDMVEAIHLVQEQMGITGTTAAEAAGTIQGSAGSMRAAWQNLLTGIADDNANMGELVNNFVDSFMTSASNIVPRIKKVVEGIKKLISTVVNDVFPRLKKEIPELAPLISTFEWFVKNRKIVVGAIQAIIAAFAIKKVVDFAFTVAEGIKSITVGIKAMNAAMSTNWVGALIAALGLLAAVIGTVTSSTREMSAAEKERTERNNDFAEAIKREADSYKALQDERDNAISRNDYEIEGYQSLWDELQKIVDENGKVQAGYETRAEFIAGELSRAFGIELEYQDGVIKGYQNARREIVNLMEQQRAKFVIDKQSEAAATAQEKITAATQEAVKAEKELTEATANFNTAKAEALIAEEKLRKAGKERYDDEGYFFRTAIQNFTEEEQALVAIRKQWSEAVGEAERLHQQIHGDFYYDSEGNQVASLKANYEKAKAVLEGYQYDIAVYNHNFEEFQQGHYDKLITMGKEYATEYENAIDGQLAYAKDQLEIYRQQYTTAVSASTKDGTGVMAKYAAELGEVVDKMETEYGLLEKAASEGLDNVSVKWSDTVAAMLSLGSDKKVEFRETADGMLQMYIDGVEVGGAKSVDEWTKILNASILDVSRYSGDFYGTAVYLIDGFANGLTDRAAKDRALRNIRAFTGDMIAAMEKESGIASPSKKTKQIGIYLVEGLELGIASEERNALSQIGNLGRAMVDELRGEMDFGDALGGIASPGASNVRLSRAVGTEAERESGMVAAFKQALGAMTIELDDEIAGKFVEKTVAAAIYAG